MKCKVKREMKDPALKKLDNGRFMLRGACPTCSTNMCLFINEEEAAKYKGKSAAKPKSASKPKSAKPKTAKSASKPKSA